MRVKDRWAAARDVGEVLGLSEATTYGPFAELKFDNAASLDFMDTEGEIHGQHYTFLVSEEEFDLIPVACGTTAASGGPTPSRVNRTRSTTRGGGRGLYWEGPDGHWLEIITCPFGSGE